MKLLWIGLGASVAFAVVYQLGRAKSAADSVARTMTPEGFAQAFSKGVDEISSLVSEIGAAMQEQEARLSEEFLPDPESERTTRTSYANRPGAAGAGAGAWDDVDL